MSIDRYLSIDICRCIVAITELSQTFTKQSFDLGYTHMLKTTRQFRCK